MGQIRVMSEALANQIAAGEVLERPSSCVKELIENSLDAGAHSIDVSIEEGGIQSITVQDDGCGMDKDDAILCFSRHATSKLVHSRDLFHISTLGFRGEALASIAAVARVALQTKKHESEYGIELHVEGTAYTHEPRAVGTQAGTRIEVRDLFFNTPARLKYLRSVATEQARCVEVVQKAALSRPDVSFRCGVSGHTVFQSPGSGQLLDVIAALYGVGEAKQFISLEGETVNYRVTGFVGRPTQAKSSRAHGHLFVNGRPVRNLAVHQAVLAGFGSRIMVNRHPMYVLHVEMDPTLVDVNIHPHKSEVRFSEERELALFIQNTVRERMDEVFLVPTIRLSSSVESVEGKTFGSASPEREQTTQSQLSLSNVTDARDGRQSFHPEWGRKEVVREYRQSDGAERPVWNPKRSTAFTDTTRKALDAAMAKAAVVEPPTPERVSDEPSPSVSKHDTEASEIRKKPLNWALRPIGQALGMYILADDGENLFIIDQHAAHERVLYERFHRRMSEREIHRIPLLMPLTLHLTPSQYAMVMSKRELLESIGLECESFGGYDLLVRTVPDVWEGLDGSALADQVISSLSEADKRVEMTTYLREQIVMRACKAAIKANWYVSSMEMEALCAALTDLEDPFHCPHGRPVFIRMSNRDLEKEFRRIV